jgi:preprotein translocase subunit SecG
MLSFLKEGQLKPLGGESNLPAAEGEQAGSRADYLTVAGHGKKLQQSTMLLAILFVVGTAGVWVMIRKAAPSQAAAAEAQKKNDFAEIESAVAQLNGMQNEVSSQMKNVNTRLNHITQVGQVAVEDLKKNPFIIDVTSLANSANPAQKQALEDQMRRKAATFELWTISESPRGLSCMINDKVLYAGDAIDGFVVKEIRPTSVVLEQNDIRVELKIE